MKAEDNNKYTVIHKYSYDKHTYIYKAIYKYKRNIYKFVYEADRKNEFESNGIYQLTDNGWVKIEIKETVDQFSQIEYIDFYKWINYERTEDEFTEKNANLFFEGCVKYINFLMS